MPKRSNKIKPMSIDEMILAIDRLTRFKAPEVKYNRVFKELISKYLIEPKISYKDYENLNPEQVCALVEEIFEFSVSTANADKLPRSLYKKIAQEEERIFETDDNTKKLLSAKIPYEAIFELISDNSALCKNLKFYFELNKSKQNAKQIRESFSTKFPVEKAVLAEGITEEILLPKFGKILGYDFDKNGTEVIAAGGKSRVAKDYIKLINNIKIPIIILLDADAKSIAEKISDKLRPSDKLLLIEKGEFEDILPLKLIKKAINYKFLNLFKISTGDFSKTQSRVKDLEYIYHKNALGEFKKADFAHTIDTVLDLKSQNFVSDEIKNIIEEIKNT